MTSDERPTVRLRAYGNGKSLICRQLGFLLTLLCALSGLMMGCSSAEPMAVEPPAPVKQPFVAPDWESTEFRSDDGGFYVHYPADFQAQPLQGSTALLSAASPNLVPRMDANRLDGAVGADLDTVAAGIEETMGQLGGGEAEVVAQKMVSLRDGVTEAMEFDVNWTFQGFPLSSVVLVVPVRDYHVNLTVTGMDGGDRAELADMAYTLTIPGRLTPDA